VSKKVKVSKEQFAEALLQWANMQISAKAIKQDARALDLTSEAPFDSRESNELFGLSLSNSEHLMILLDELLALNLWIVTAVCESKFKDEEQLNNCLDIFFRRFFDEILKGTVQNYDEWMEFMKFKHDEYREAIRAGKEMALGGLIQRNLHGEGYPKALLNWQIVVYVRTGIKALTGALDQYEIK
jgi:hypothetical protein